MSDAAQTITPTDPGQGSAPVDTASVETPSPVEEAPAVVEPTDGVQPGDDATAQPDGGQGLIAKYLEGVDEAHRDVVAEALERQRQDSDAQVTKRFERLSQLEEYLPEGATPDYLSVPVALYENLMQSPVETLRWVFDQFQANGVDLKSQLLEAADTADPQEPAPQDDPADDDLDRPLTRRELLELQEQQRQEAEAERVRAQNRELAKSWFEEAAADHGLTLDENDVAVRTAVLQHAAQIMPQLSHLGAQEAPKQAIATAVEAFVNRFRSAPQEPAATTTEPTVATGGTPPAPPEPGSLDSASDRRAFMRDFITGLKTQE